MTLHPWPLGIVDNMTLGGLLVSMITLGVWAGRHRVTTRDFFLGGRKIPAWAVCLSMIATEVSALTLVGVPATAFRENWEYAQFFIGSFAARVAIAYWFIPIFYAYNCTTIYEFLKHRFGPATQYTASVFFFITRLIGSGIRLMAGSLAISVILDLPIELVIGFFILFGVAYIVYGGIKAVIWTGVFQGLIFVAAGGVTIAYLILHIQGGWTTFHLVATQAGKLKLWDWGPSLHQPHFAHAFFSDPNIVWIAILNGFFGSLAAFGTDQELMQRLLTIETRQKSQRTMVAAPFASFAVLLIYLTIGTGLFVYYHQFPATALPQKLDKIFPFFIKNVLPAGLRGFVFSAILMATLDSPLMSLSASFITDIYKPLLQKDRSDAHYLVISRVSVVVFALLLAGIAYASSFYNDILWLAFKIGGVTFGSLLGVFLLGIFTKRRSNYGNVIGMVTMMVVNGTLLTLSELKIVPIGWTWLVLIGTAGTFAIGWFLGPYLEQGNEVPL